MRRWENFSQRILRHMLAKKRLVCPQNHSRVTLTVLLACSHTNHEVFVQDIMACVPLSTWHKKVINHQLCTGVMRPIKEPLRRWGVDLDKPMTFENFYDQSLPKEANFALNAMALNEYMEPFRPTLWEKPNVNQELVQCWFPGDHIDSGTGGCDCQIPDITLAWMVTQLETQRGKIQVGSLIVSHAVLLGEASFGRE